MQVANPRQLRRDFESGAKFGRRHARPASARLARKVRIEFVISAAGATGRMPAWIERFRFGAVFCGHDAGFVGDHAVGMLETRDPEVRCMWPGGCGIIEDRNDILKRGLGGGGFRPSGPGKPHGNG